MRILFAYPYVSSYRHAPFDYGIASLSAIVKKDGHTTSLLSFHSTEPERFQTHIDKFNPELICLSVWSGKIREAVEFVEWVTKYNAPIIVGGIYPTVAPNQAVELFKDVCGICIGEGDIALRNFVKALEAKEDYSQTKNFWIRQQNTIVQNPLGPLVSDLDTLPFPDRDIFDLQESINDTGTVKFNATRGCPYSCSFCAEAHLKKLYPKERKLRRRSARGVLNEIQSVLKTYRNIQHIGFDDDCFTLGKKWLHEFCRAYASEVGIPFYINTRVDLMDDETAEWLKKANCTEIRMGIESGNDTLRNTILQKDISKEQILQAFQIVKNHGIHSLAYNMIGVPYETEETLRETIELNRLIAPDYVRVSVFQPYLGTPLYNLCKSNGWIREVNRETSYYGPYLLEQPSISVEKLAHYYKLFTQLFQAKMHVEMEPEIDLISQQL